MTQEQKKEPENKKPEAQESEEMQKAAKKDKELQELTETVQRLQADFENYRKRVEKERSWAVEQAKIKVIQELLPIIDTFQLALKNKNNHDQFVKGVEMLYGQLYNTFHNMGVKPIETRGKMFDPHRHEILMQEVKDNSKEGEIIEEFQKGYMLKDVVIRTSKVKIAKKREAHDKTGNTAEHHQ